VARKWGSVEAALELASKTDPSWWKARTLEDVVCGENSLANVREHAPPLAGASFGRGVRVVGTLDHVNRAASGGCVSRLVLPLIYTNVSSRTQGNLSREIPFAFRSAMTHAAISTIQPP
jgi:hypothetical protein